jgi:ribosome recycling factor
MDDRREDMQKQVEHFENELKKIRAGRANASMLDGVMVEAYGTNMPLNQVASISTPEPQLLQITPFDVANLQAISAGVRADQNLGLNPMDDGHVVRVQLPPLTTERREQLVRQLSDKAEEAKVSLRNIRHEAQKTAKNQLKDKIMSEDDYARVEKQLDDHINEFQAQIDKLVAAKEQEIMSV